MLGAIERMKVLVKNHAATVGYQRELTTMYSELGAELLLSDDITKAKEYSALAMAGVDIAKLSRDASIGELKPQAVSLALTLALARREGKAADELLEKLKLICGRLKTALPKCEAVQLVTKLASDAVGN